MSEFTYTVTTVKTCRTAREAVIEYDKAADDIDCESCVVTYVDGNDIQRRKHVLRAFPITAIKGEGI